jgi:tRNA1Val (adenine37-N6)-methyltransferase
MTNETIDDLRAYGLRLIQPRDGYRFSLDPLLLCDFVEAGTCERIADLGTGCGIIPLVLARRAAAAFVGVEFQEEMAGIAARNVALNVLQDRVEIICDDVIALRKRFPVSSFDLVVANPPYRTPGSGRISPRAGRDLARHESSAGLADFLSVAKYLVKPGGKICFIYHVSRLTEIFEQAISLKLALLRIRMVHGHPMAKSSMVLIELAKGRKNDLEVLPPLFVHDACGEYSNEMKRVLEELHA